MSKKTASQPATTAPATPAAAASAVAVVRTEGPAEMFFCGRLWYRDQPQTIPVEHWAGMQSRNAARLGFTVLITPAEET